MRYFFRTEYDGAAYCGWQVQPNGLSVQETIVKAFSTVTRVPGLSVVGAGRTDSGVHARAQGVHVDLDHPIDTGAVMHSVNGILPRDIAVYDLQPVPSDFHARYSAQRRCYHYTITQRKMPLLRRRAWHVPYTVDWQRVEHHLADVVGTFDFTTFRAANSDTPSSRCTIHRAELVRNNGLYRIILEADRFLYRMVRSVVGTLIDIGRGASDIPLRQRIEARNRGVAGTTAPAHGLTLYSVDYPALGEQVIG